MPIVEITDMEKHLVEKHFVPAHPDVPVRCGDVMIGILGQCASISILFSAGTFSEPRLPVNDSALEASKEASRYTDIESICIEIW